MTSRYDTRYAQLAPNLLRPLPLARTAPNRDPPKPDQKRGWTANLPLASPAPIGPHWGRGWPEPTQHEFMHRASSATTIKYTYSHKQ